MTIHVDALISDTVGTLLTGTYQTKEGYCFAGLILGTGSNVCYWEKMGNIHKIPGGDCEGGCAEEKMVINVESGNFGSRSDFDGVFPMNEFDKELDQHSPNSGEQLLEKQISGMYLGEMWRLVVKKYVDQGLIFASYLTPLTFVVFRSLPFPYFFFFLFPFLIISFGIISILGLFPFWDYFHLVTFCFIS
eukprot:TRINITY_DN708_c0_g1_i5.p1 TRINITY_DN708_c0_g1~~TRINITY_DN708_c0_g1_i5.p1  ORF type:complete len:190 (-),score=40.65 TRINITY_DN708_c0_g1_i5:515-1084(-)